MLTLTGYPGKYAAINGTSDEAGITVFLKNRERCSCCSCDINVIDELDLTATGLLVGFGKTIQEAYDNLQLQLK